MAQYWLAKEYCQRPRSLDSWDADEFDEAWDLFLAENVEKWPGDRAQAAIPAVASQTTILDRPQDYWRAFVVNGSLDTARLLAANYSEPQIPWIAGEMKKLGWLGE